MGTRSPKRLGRADSGPAIRSHPKPMVFAGIFPVLADEYEPLRDALGKRNKRRGVFYEPENSVALGFVSAAAFLLAASRNRAGNVWIASSA